MPQESNHRPMPIFTRLWRSIIREPIHPSDDRGRMRMVVNSLILHLHPTKVERSALRFSYTFGLGGLNIMLCALLGITGLLLMFAYTPSPDEAYASIRMLSAQIWFGQLIRNLHHWSANLLIITAGLHLLRVFYTGAFRNPRQFNWQLGVALLFFVAIANFTGYLLPWDQLAFWAITVGTNMLAYFPGGESLRRALIGGHEVGAPTLSNFYVLHVAIIPLIIFMVSSFHIWRVRKDKFSTPRNAGEQPSNKVERVTTIPHLVSREFIFALAALAGLLVWSSLVNAPLEAAANPVHPPNPTKAAWYFAGIQELLLHFHPLFGLIVIPGLVIGALLALPELDPHLESVGIWFRTLKGGRIASASMVAGFLGAWGYVLLDDFVLNRLASLPFLPTAISTFFIKGLLPLILLTLALVLFNWLLRKLGANSSERIMAIFSLLLAAYLALTIIGVTFRGEGMAFTIPW